MKKCGWCGEEAEDYFEVWKKNRLVMRICKKCSKREDFNKRIREYY